jgi:hypothetical protein
VSKADKKEQRIRQNPTNVSLEDFEVLIRKYGVIILGGRHPKAHIGGHIYPYKRENPVKAHYVEAVLRFIDEVQAEED